MVQTLERKTKPEKTGDRIPQSWLALACVLGVLVAYTLIAFGSTLNCYFLADDYAPLSYMYQGLHGNLAGWVAHLWGPWQDASMQLLLRPVCELTLALDFLLWHSEAVGYHLTNLFWHTLSAVSLYFLCTVIERKGASDFRRPSAFAFMVAALFATCPMHSEAVSWMIARVDSICASFYLLAFLFFARTRQRSVASLVCFVLALLSKEMAVTLPAVLFSYSYICEASSWKNALRRTAPYWLVLAPYFAIRTFVLGSPIGGYVGVMGELFAQTPLDRLITSDYSKLLFPFSMYSPTPANLIVPCLTLLYAALAVLAVVRMRVFPIERSPGACAGPAPVMRFSAVWLAIAMLPVLPVWYLNSGLTGGRFLYLPSVAFWMLVAAPLLLGVRKSIRLIAIGLLSGLIAMFCWIANWNNEVWIASGDDARALRSSLERTVRHLPSGAQLALLNAPRQRNGEAMFYTDGLLRAFLKPPNTAADISQRVANLQPDSFRPEDMQNASVLKKMIASGANVFYRWDNVARVLLPVRVAEPVTLVDVPKIDWSDDSFLLGLDATLRARNNSPMCIFYDAGTVHGGSGAVLEISYCNAMFLHKTGMLRDDEFSPSAAQRIQLPAPDGAYVLSPDLFPAKGLYQVRIVAVNASGTMVGFASDPLSIDLRAPR